jgi:outer membrane lipoprotein-sorting protein
VLCGGCATAPPRQPVADDARRALALLDARWREFTDLRTLVDIVLARGRETLRFTGVLLAKGPDSVRFEALSPLGQPVRLVTVHEGRLTAYDVAKNEALVGPASPETILRLLWLPLDADALVAVLAGRPVPPRDLRVAELMPADGLGPSLTLVGADQRQRVWMDLETGEVRQLEIDGGRFPVTITFRHDGDAPSGFDLLSEPADVTGSVTYRNLVVGGGIEPERFTLALPKGAKTQNIR